MLKQQDDSGFMQRLNHFLQNARNHICSRVDYIVLTQKSLFYNSLLSLYWIEVLLRPLIRIIDRFSRSLGQLLVVGVIVLTIIICSIVYFIGLPYYWNNYPNLTVILMVYGHWLLLNVVFNYYKGLVTDPGAPPKGYVISEAVSVCKVCILPKPPRTHHCSVCNRCILKMDHHCPWLNNCVGHYNHRYFYMYMVYMVLGTMFIMMFGFEIAYREIWLGGERGTGWQHAALQFMGWINETETPDKEEDLHSGMPGHFNETHFIPSFEGTTGFPILIEPHPDDEPEYNARTLYRFAIMFTSMLTTGAFIALLLLVLFHGRLISKGETSIEAHINKKERERLKNISKKFRNPYNHGVKENWKNFLGLDHRRGFSLILLPSSHPPFGNGLKWPNSVLKSGPHDKIV